MKTYNTIDILALSFAAHRINDGYVRETRRYSEEDNSTKFSNKELLRYHFMEKIEYRPLDFKQFMAFPEDVENAKQAVIFLNKENTLQVMAGTVSSFMDSLLKCINSETVTVQEFGVVTLLPKVYFETKEKKEFKKKIKTEFSESVHIGSVGTKIEGKVVIDDIRFVDKFGCHVVNGHIDSNLVTFFKEFNAGTVVPKKGDVLKIKGKVKRHGENFTTRIPETQLNYVTIV